MSKKLRVRAAAQRALDAEYDDAMVSRLVSDLDSAIERGETSVTYPRRGRPSLSGERQASPTVGFRVTLELKHHAELVAHREGVTVSELARRALETYVRKAG